MKPAPVVFRKMFFFGKELTLYRSNKEPTFKADKTKTFRAGKLNLFCIKGTLKSF